MMVQGRKRLATPALHADAQAYVSADIHSNWGRVIRHMALQKVVSTGNQTNKGARIHSFTMLTINADAHPVMSNFHKPEDEKRMVVILGRLKLLAIRLSGADTPETGQAYWRVARGFLREFVAGKPTTAWCYKTDARRREVCHVRVGELDAIEALIAGGYGWHARMFDGELSGAQRRVYGEAENVARSGRQGLWLEDEPMPPWGCRTLRKIGQACR